MTQQWVFYCCWFSKKHQSFYWDYCTWNVCFNEWSIVVPPYSLNCPSYVAYSLVALVPRLQIGRMIKFTWEPVIHYMCMKRLLQLICVSYLWHVSQIVFAIIGIMFDMYLRLNKVTSCCFDIIVYFCCTVAVIQIIIIMTYVLFNVNIRSDQLMH